MSTQVGRISGPLLKSNLLRDGVDLAFDTDLLFLDVVNNRIGIKNTSPAKDLHLNGSFYSTGLIIDNSITVGNLILYGNNTISTLVGPLYLSAGSLITTSNTLTAGHISITTNQIHNDTPGEDLEIAPNGTGKLFLPSNDLYISGSLHATGDITFDNNVIFGDNTNQDTITFNADVNTPLLPNATLTYDLGQNSPTSLKWKTVYLNSLTNYSSLTSSQDLIVNGTHFGVIQGKIWYVATNGSSGNAGNHPNSPFNSIQLALSNASYGDTVYVYPGTYTETFPLTIPSGVTIKGSDIRTCILVPSLLTNNQDAFLLNTDTSVVNITISNFYYNSSANTGYAFKLASGFTFNNKSPYIYNVSVITKGSITSASDPRGFDTGDAGKAIYLDGSVADPSSIQASISVVDSTFITPGVDSVTLINGATAELKNIFTYYANRSYYVPLGPGRNRTVTLNTPNDSRLISSPTQYRISTVDGSTSHGNYSNTLDGGNASSTPNSTVNDNSSIAGSFLCTQRSWELSGYKVGSILTNSTYFVPGTVVTSVQGPQTSYGISYYTVYISNNLVTDIPFGTSFNVTGKIYNTNIKSFNSSSCYGNYSAHADGLGSLINLNNHMFYYVGSRKNDYNDDSLVSHTTGVLQTNSGKVFYVSINESGVLNIGDNFYIDAINKTTSINWSVYNTINEVITIDSSNISSIITSTQITTGNILLTGNTLESISGSLNFSANSTQTYLQSNVSAQTNFYVSGNLNAQGNVVLGSLSTNNIIINPKLNQDIIPKNDNFYKLGSSSSEWLSVWGNDFHLSSIEISGSTISTTITNSNLNLLINGVGTVYLGSLSFGTSITSTDNITLSTGAKSLKINSNTALVLPKNSTSYIPNPITPGGIISESVTVNLIIPNDYRLATPSSLNYFRATKISWESSGLGIGSPLTNPSQFASGTTITNVQGPYNDFGLDYYIIFVSNNPLIDFNPNDVVSSSIYLFTGANSTARITLGGVYSSDRLTYVQLDPTNQKINFNSNGNTLLSVSSLGLTNVPAIQFGTTTLSNSSFTSGSSNITLQANGTGSVKFNSSIKINNNVITNLTNNPLVWNHTGTGYLKFTGSLGIVIPSGNVGTRQPTPEIGTTRYNSDYGYMEVYNGTAWVVSAGSIVTSTSDITNLSDIWSLILG